MDGFGLLIGHLVGDYVLQNDWMAANKANPNPGPKPWPHCHELCFARRLAGWEEQIRVWRRGSLACFVHCTVYSLVVWIFSFWWMPWWGIILCWLTHYPLDRYRLARWLMENVTGQRAFASGPLSPWSVVVFDNTLHLLTLFLIKAASLAV